jgi:Flp pilus assembly protein TadG
MSRYKTLLARRSPAAFARDERGAAMVEFSIIAFLLLVMVFGMVDYGRYFLIRANLTNAVREGARYGATLAGATTTNQGTIATYTRARINGTAAQQNEGTLVASETGPVGAKRVRVELSAYPFNPATFLVIKSAKSITVAAEFRKEQP